MGTEIAEIHWSLNADFIKCVKIKIKYAETDIKKILHNF